MTQNIIFSNWDVWNGLNDLCGNIKNCCLWFLGGIFRLEINKLKMRYKTNCEGYNPLITRCSRELDKQIVYELNRSKLHVFNVRIKSNFGISHTIVNIWMTNFYFYFISHYLRFSYSFIFLLVCSNYQLRYLLLICSPQALFVILTPFFDQHLESDDK